MAISIPLKRSSSFCTPQPCKAPRLTSASASRSVSLPDREMTRVPPPFDLAHSQYLCPNAPFASGRAASKARLRAQFDSPSAYQKQLARFVAQIAYEHARNQQSSQPFPTLDPVRRPPQAQATELSPRAPPKTVAAFFSPKPVRPSAKPTNPPSTSTSTPTPPKSKPKSKSIISPLRVPGPRVSSSLSPVPHSLLPGPARRPMPPSRNTPECLRKQAVLNLGAERVRRREAVMGDDDVEMQEVVIGDEDVAMESPTDDKLKRSSWILVPPHDRDWELVDLRACT